jgi:hypothetical protein
MRKLVVWALVGLGVLASTHVSHADWGTLHYGGYQPRWAFWTRFNRSHCTTEEERWLKFWHDYYDALEHYYGRLAHIDWVTYYKFTVIRSTAVGQACVDLTDTVVGLNTPRSSSARRCNGQYRLRRPLVPCLDQPDIDTVMD